MNLKDRIKKLEDERLREKIRTLEKKKSMFAFLGVLFLLIGMISSITGLLVINTVEGMKTALALFSLSVWLVPTFDEKYNNCKKQIENLEKRSS